MKTIDELELAVRRLAAVGEDAVVMSSCQCGRIDGMLTDDPRIDLASVGLLPLWVGAWHATELIDRAARDCGSRVETVEILARVRAWTCTAVRVRRWHDGDIDSGTNSVPAQDVGQWSEIGVSLAENLHVLGIAIGGGSAEPARTPISPDADVRHGRTKAQALPESPQTEQASGPCELLGYEAAAALLGVSPATLRRHVDRGELRIVCLGRRRMFRRGDLVRFIQKCSAERKKGV